jgi:uncharacterized membrane protein
MTVRPASDHDTVPGAVFLLAGLAIFTGWLLFQGVSFVLGCVVMLALVGAAVALLVPHRRG